jgi:hypothetical protein
VTAKHETGEDADTAYSDISQGKKCGTMKAPNKIKGGYIHE